MKVGSSKSTAPSPSWQMRLLPWPEETDQKPKSLDPFRCTTLWYSNMAMGIPLWMAGFICFMGKSSMICFVLINYIAMFDYQRGYHIYMCGFCSCLHSTADSSLSTQQHQAPRALQIDHLVIPTLRITETSVSKMPRFFKNPALSTSSIIFSIFPAMDLWCWDFWHLLSWYHHGGLMQPIKMIRMSKFVTLRPRNLHALQLAYDLS